MARVGLAILALGALIGSSNGMACVIPPQPVLDSDLTNVPDGLIAAQAEIAYRRLVSDWQATGPKEGAGVTPGRASQRPSKGKAARQAV